MINLNFFPSPRLARYTVWLYVSRSLAVLLSLSIVLMMLNLLSESGKILAVPGNSSRMLAKARDSAADEVFCDLEDAVPPSEKEARSEEHTSELQSH